MPGWSTLENWRGSLEKGEDEEWLWYLATKAGRRQALEKMGDSRAPQACVSGKRLKDLENVLRQWCLCVGSSGRNQGSCAQNAGENLPAVARWQERLDSQVLRPGKRKEEWEL
jgi:hypothetical protein